MNKPKKTLSTGQQVYGEEYRMFIATVPPSANPEKDLRAVKRWVRKNSMGKFCISEWHIPTVNVGRFSLEHGSRVLVGFTDDADSMALRLTFDDVEETNLWERRMKFSVYDFERE